MKIITIAGNVGKDGELRRTQNGDPVLSFSVAVAGIGRDAPSTWFDVSLFGKRGESLEPMIRKGGYVIASGDLGTREHNGKTYLTIRANEVTLGPRREASNEAPARSGSQTARTPAPTSAASDFDDEIPFAPDRH